MNELDKRKFTYSTGLNNLRRCSICRERVNPDCILANTTLSNGYKCTLNICENCSKKLNNGFKEKHKVHIKKLKRLYRGLQNE